MAYLKNTNNKVVVDAILTKYGEAKLASQGNLDIVKFAVADDEIDYALYNTSHPDGSDYYGSALANLPTTEALPEEYLSMKYPQFSITEGALDAVAEMRLNYTTTITGSGIINYTVYPITPSFNPEPGDTTRIYYVSKLTIPQPVPGGGGGGGVGGGGDGVPNPVPLQNIGRDGSTPPPTGKTSTGAQFKMGATINEDIGITSAIVAARGFYINTTKYQYSVGHGFTFQVTRFGRSDVYLPFTVTPFGINARPVTITVKINGRDKAQLKQKVEVQ